MHKRNDSDEGVNVSSNLWEMLRKTFIMMVIVILKKMKRNENDIYNYSFIHHYLFFILIIIQDRRDLADKAIAGADLNQFRNEFEF